MNECEQWGDERVWLCADQGEPISTPRTAMDAIGDALAACATVVAVPVRRLGDEFFRLSSGLAGEFAQKAVNYRLRLAVVGDIERFLADSEALRAWVRECGRRQDVLFVADRQALAERLKAVDANDG